MSASNLGSEQPGYKSKKEIYKDYLIAVKFIPTFLVTDKSNYQKLFKAFESELGAKIAKFTETLENYGPSGPPAHAYILECPAGKPEEASASFILLTHETGLEAYIVPVALIVLGAVGEVVLEKALSAAIDPVVEKMCGVLRNSWSELMSPGRKFKIERVQIRTESKGVMDIPFANFEFSQIECLLRNWNSIRHLSQLNDACFGGLLNEPEAGGYGEISELAKD